MWPIKERVELHNRYLASILRIFRIPAVDQLKRLNGPVLSVSRFEILSLRLLAYWRKKYCFRWWHSFKLIGTGFRLYHIHGEKKDVLGHQLQVIQEHGMI